MVSRYVSNKRCITPSRLACCTNGMVTCPSAKTRPGLGLYRKRFRKSSRSVLHVCHLLACLPSDCLDVLTLASLLGDTIAIESLAMLTQSHLETIYSALNIGMLHGVILQRGKHFRFAHGLIRQGFATRLGAKARQHLHLQIAQGFERLDQDHPGAYIFEIAHHLIEAGTLVAARTLMTYAKRGGDQARAQFAWGEAVRYYEAALSAVEALQDIAPQELAALYVDAGFGHRRNLDVGLARDRFEKAATCYRRLGDAVGLAKVLIFLIRLDHMDGSMFSGTLSSYVTELETVFTALSDADLNLRGHVLALLAQAYRFAK